MTEQPSRILHLFAHPAFQKSRVNRVLVEAAQRIHGLTFHDLYQAYPHFVIDVRREQELLLSHEILVFHHPFFWYSTPAILKEWQDLVLEHGWAYGRDGSALHGKTMLNVVTTGGSGSAYHADGHNRFTMRQLLAPIEQTARLCGMDYLPPFVVHGTHGMQADEMTAHAGDLQVILEALRDRRVDRGSLSDLLRINADLGRFSGTAPDLTADV